MSLASRVSLMLRASSVTEVSVVSFGVSSALGVLGVSCACGD